MRDELTPRPQRKTEHGSSRDGFNLTELMVVMATIGMLALLLLPALAGTKHQDNSAVCMNNLRQIYNGMMAYATDYNDTMHHTGDGYTPNGGQWTADPTSTAILSPNDSRAYWGVAYHSFVGMSRELFRCPGAKIVDEWVDSGLSYPHEFWLTSTYGLNQYLTRSYAVNTFLKVTDIENPSTMIMTHDAAEQRMEGSFDTLALFPGDTRILQQWIGANAPVMYGGISAIYYGGYHFEEEWYRHDRRSNTLWLSGQVQKIPFTGYAAGIDYRYYTGEKPLSTLPGN
jgi:prepilin-type N-terminal cleavage/methylation domain-containing protein